MGEVQMIPVSSSNVAAIGYDAANQRIYVRFVNGPGGYYEGCDADLFQAFLDSDSKGSFLGRKLKGVYPYSRS